MLCDVGRKKAQQGFELEGVELEDLQRSCPTSTTLQFCDCEFFADFSKFSPKGLCLGFPTVAQSSIKQTPNSRALLLFPCHEKMDQTQETFGVGFSAILVPNWDGAGQLRVEDLSHLVLEGEHLAQLCHGSRKTGAWYFDLHFPDPGRFPVLPVAIWQLCAHRNSPVVALLQLLPLSWRNERAISVLFHFP